MSAESSSSSKSDGFPAPLSPQELRASGPEDTDAFVRGAEALHAAEGPNPGAAWHYAVRRIPARGWVTFWVVSVSLYLGACFWLVIELRARLAK
jgi:hypothetical protein